MLRVIAEVLTNSEDDEFGRVKLKCPTIWDESDLVPSLNAISLEIGDTVLVEVQDTLDAFILGRVRTKAQIENDPKGEKEGEIVYQHKNGDKWSVLRALGSTLFWENSVGVKLHIEEDKIDFHVPEGVPINIKTGDSVNAEVEKDTTTTVSGNKTETVEGEVSETVQGSVTRELKSTVDLKISGSTKIEATEVNLKATKVVIDSAIECTHMATPDGKGPFNPISSCIFSGAVHCSSKVN